MRTASRTTREQMTPASNTSARPFPRLLRARGHGSPATRTLLDIGVVTLGIVTGVPDRWGRGRLARRRWWWFHRNLGGIGRRITVIRITIWPPIGPPVGPDADADPTPPMPAMEPVPAME